MTALRSFLYVPGDAPAKLAKVATSAADAVILDLEDAVAQSAKAAARDLVCEMLAAAPAGTGPALWVRLNAGSAMVDDLLAVAEHAALAGVVVPKASVNAIDLACSLVPGVAIAPLVETASGWCEVEAIATAHPLRVTHLAIGEADLAADLGLDPSPDGGEWWPYRARLVAASAAARLSAPCGPVSTDFADLDGLRAETDALRRAGFGARSAIHPAQVPVINAVFTPTPAAVEAARDVLGRFEDALAAGDGLCLDERGRMIDEAVVRSARRVLARAAGRSAG